MQAIGDVPVDEAGPAQTVAHEGSVLEEEWPCAVVRFR